MSSSFEWAFENPGYKDEHKLTPDQERQKLFRDLLENDLKSVLLQEVAAMSSALSDPEDSSDGIGMINLICRDDVNVTIVVARPEKATLTSPVNWETSEEDHF